MSHLRDTGESLAELLLSTLGIPPTSEARRRTLAARQAPRCRHLRTSGARCGSPALSGQDYCYFHQRFRDDHGLDLPLIEDAHAVQVALMQVLRALSSGLVDYKFAALMLYGLQVASANLKRLETEAAAEREERQPGSRPELALLPQRDHRGNVFPVLRENTSAEVR